MAQMNLWDSLIYSVLNYSIIILRLTFSKFDMFKSLDIVHAVVALLNEDSNCVEANDDFFNEKESRTTTHPYTRTHAHFAFL